MAMTLEETKEAVAKHYANYRFDLLVAALYDFVWHDYCDWAIETSKQLLVADTPISVQPLAYWSLYSMKLYGCFIQLYHL